MWSNGGMMTDRVTSKGSEENLPQIVYHKSNRIYILEAFTATKFNTILSNGQLSHSFSRPAFHIPTPLIRVVIIIIYLAWSWATC